MNWLNPWWHRSANALGALFSGVLVWRAFWIWRFNGHFSDLLFALTAAIEIVLYLIRALPSDFRPTLKEALICVSVSFGLVFLKFPPGHGLWPAAGAVLMLAGLVIQLSAKVALGRSYGVFAANRGVRTGGPYRFIRHPIYFGYLFIALGFLVSHWHWWNAAIYVTAYALQIWRILNEERLLGADAAYQAYRERVRWRLIPGLF